MEAYNLPVGLRLWWLKRMNKQAEEENKEIEKAQNKK